MERKKPSNGVLEDIQDGIKYQALLKQGWFNDACDLGLVLSTDGGALFKSSGTSAWPVWAVNTNLSPSMRCV